MNYNKNIYEGWTPLSFIEELEPLLEMIQNGQSWESQIKTKDELKIWLKNNQPFYKKDIPEVIKHFSRKYNLK